MRFNLNISPLEAAAESFLCRETKQKLKWEKLFVLVYQKRVDEKKIRKNL